MKIKITYQEEKELEGLLSQSLRQLLKQGAKLRKSDKHTPFKHAYITIGGNTEKGDTEAKT